MKKIALLILFGLLTIGAFAQLELESNDRSFKERLYFGGNFWLAFGTYTYVEVSPRVGYMINNRASVGVGANYIYQSYEVVNSNNQRSKESNSIYGGTLFGRYNITRQFFIYGELEMLSLEYFNPQTRQVKREWVPGLLVGGGYFQPFGNRGGMSVMVLYNIFYDPVRTYYPSPLVLRIGFAF